MLPSGVSREQLICVLFFHLDDLRADLSADMSCKMERGVHKSSWFSHEMWN